MKQSGIKWKVCYLTIDGVGDEVEAFDDYDQAVARAEQLYQEGRRKAEAAKADDELDIPLYVVIEDID